MSEATTMTPAPTTNNGDAASFMPYNGSATADALYGNTQQSPKAQEQQVADATAAAKSKGDQEPQAEQGKAGDAPAESKTPNAPEKYEFTAPEGRQFDAEVLSTFSEIAKELDLSQEGAQKVLDKMAPKMMERQAAQLEAIRTQWADASKSDAEFGGDKIGENLSVAKKALDSFGTNELRTLLNESGLGNHPEIIRFMYRAGKAISEDRYVGSSSGNQSARPTPKDFNSAAAALYSNQS